MAYKIIINKRNGRKMCYKDGKLIKDKDIPKELLKEEVSKEEPKVKEEPIMPDELTMPTECIFDGQPREYQRDVWHKDKRVTVCLCGHCYFIKTLGEIKDYLNKLK